MLLYFHTSLLFYIFILLLTLELCSLCTADDEVRYFINCGSSMNVVDSNTGETFFGDDKNDTVPISGHGDIITNGGNLSGSLFQTARVFRKTASYDLNHLQNGTYFVRLHICATSSELADAYFSVTASGHMLLPDFKPGINSNCSSTKPWEFILSNANEKLRIYFEPNPSSIAFVNAIEVLSTTSNFSKDKYPDVSPAGRVGDYRNMDSSALETIYRINVGGEEVGALNDKLGRTWIPDDLFLINNGDAENKDERSSVDYSQRLATEDDAPLAVYGTAKMLKSTLNSSFNPNLTWKFNVSRGTKYFVRAHFCDISNAIGDYSFNFYFYINKNFSQVIAPSNIANGTDIPFFKDYVAESGDLAYLNISVGPNNAQEDRKYLFLNGLEIMQLRNVSVREPQIKESHLPLIAGSVASAVAVMGIVAIVLCLHLKRRRIQVTEAFEWGNLPLNDATSSHHRASESSLSHASTFQNLGLKIPFVEIQRVTNNFDAELIIGIGGFGKVYKGTLRSSGVNVAVKRGSEDHGQGLEEFQNEIMILSKIRHRHLVSLIGYCCENGEMILVYEFMEKGTLRYHLYDSNNSSTASTKEVLSWKKRLEICIGAAKGIQYLHESTSNIIIHRDIKSTNILLDEKLVAKVADFGISISGSLDQSHVSMEDVKGTYGYLDPEYAMNYQLTEKSDVYAFGVVLLEVLCARPVINTSLPKKQINLKDWAMVCYKEGQIETIIDPLIATEINPKSLKAFFEIAERCVRDEATDRPSMSDVTWALEYALKLQNSATDTVPLDDSMTDASLNMSLPAVRRFPSHSLADGEYYPNTETGEVFSQLTFDDHSVSGR